VNRKLHEDLSASISIAGLRVRGEAEVQELFAPSIYESNDEVHPAKIQPSRWSAAVTDSRVTFVFRRASVTRIDFRID
jgi:hypothetical protein